MAKETIITKVEYNSFAETGDDQYAHLWRVDAQGKLLEPLGVGIGDSREAALERAIAFAIEEHRITEADQLVQLEEKDYGDLSFTAGVNNLHKKGILSLGGVVEALAVLLRRGGKG